MTLADQKCKACEGGISPLTIQESFELGKQVPGWTIEEKHIERSFKFPDFAQAMEFANKIAVVADQENHHPDLHISWGNVRVELSTHSVDGLSINDFVMAAKINKIETVKAE